MGTNAVPNSFHLLNHKYLLFISLGFMITYDVCIGFPTTVFSIGTILYFKVI